MRYSKLFGKTVHGEASGSDMVSHQLLVRAGFIRESVAGRYFFLPLGWRVHEKIKAIIKEEMDAIGAQEMISPVLHPLELWQETNRTTTTGFELMSVKDRRGAAFALGGTAEEMFVDVSRKFQLSYKDLPYTVYQFSTKFRDELRARGGLLRVREFVMKDAYSFHVDESDFKKEYQAMSEAYTRIFARVGLETFQVAADNGYIGGEYCHEFQVIHPQGEGRFFVSSGGSYVAHEDIASMTLSPKNSQDALQPLTQVEAKRGVTIADGAAFHGLPEWQQLKCVVYQTDTKQLVVAAIRGDLEVNEIKLKKAVNALNIELATAESIVSMGSVPGFVSPVGLPHEVAVVSDLSLDGVVNLYGGANALHQDYLNINPGRDFQATAHADIAMAVAGEKAPDGGVLEEQRGIEVGNIFQLGLHYSSLMKGAEFVDSDGKTKPYYMGCYGIGLGRTLATVVEQYHDEKGICWPDAIAPYSVHLISLPGGEEMAAKVYDQLMADGIDVLWDDRAISAGAKFTDADLIGIPWRVVVSKKTGDQVEVKQRRSSEASQMEVTQLLDVLTSPK